MGHIVPAGQTGTVLPPDAAHLPFASMVVPGGQNCPAVVPPLDNLQVPSVLTVAPGGQIMALMVVPLVVHFPSDTKTAPAGQKKPFDTVPGGGGAQVALLVPSGQARPGVRGVQGAPGGQKLPAGGGANVPFGKGAMPFAPATALAFIMPVLIAVRAEGSFMPIVLPVESLLGGNMAFTMLFPAPAANL